MVTLREIEEAQNAKVKAFERMVAANRLPDKAGDRIPKEAEAEFQTARDRLNAMLAQYAKENP